MSNITELSIAQLKKVIGLKEKLAKLENELASLIGASSSSGPVKQKGGMSAAGRKAVAEAQKKRWAKIKGQAKTAKDTTAKPAKRKMSAAGRAAISRAAKARWAKVKAGKK